MSTPWLRSWILVCYFDKAIRLFRLRRNCVTRVFWDLLDLLVVNSLKSKEMFSLPMNQKELLGDKYLKNKINKT